ncbi:DUF262 domain-containing protein [Candidatus Saccharibacteria bacterium]|nr:DUF262 domain-containing protein [Candidatus Saccharibacteria bacterium]
MDSKTKFDFEFVGNIKGSFLIPSYQRGYRWGKDEVQQLLTDILQNGEHDYLLQPVVVRHDGGLYRVIDGQQRLTTIYLIYKYCFDNDSVRCLEPLFTIQYETRPQSKEFLAFSYQEMTNKKDLNIDFWFIHNAYYCIDQWFTEHTQDFKLNLIHTIYRRLNRRVKVIWYEADESEDEKKLFARLNIGKIPLTNAELIKAMFLSGSNIDAEKTNLSNRQLQLLHQQNELAIQWDMIEQELSRESFWYFLTNAAPERYQTRIDLIFDLIAGTTSDGQPYRTFQYFDSRMRDNRKQNDFGGLKQIWEQEVLHTYLSLKDWYEDRELYHKIGYLISSQFKTLAEIYQLSKEKPKSIFKHQLDLLIKESIALNGKSLEELSYDEDAELIRKILLLFNVESVRGDEGEIIWFPFDRFKRENWSLEHIHAQHPETMNHQDLWRDWLRLQLKSLEVIVDPADRSGQELMMRVRPYCDEEHPISGAEFRSLQKDIVDGYFAKDSNADSVHSISNLALLDCNNNAALSNSTFDVKRREIIERDQRGAFIPHCTKMVFLKYYSKSSDTQIHFWSEDDRRSYLSRIKDVLEPYIDKEENTDV